VASTAETQAVDAFPRGLVWGFAVTETISWGVLFYALPVLLVPMADDLGWSRSTIVGAFSLAIVVSGLAAPVVGRRLDRTDPRWLLTGGSVLATGLVLAWSQVESLVVYYGIWLAIGVVKAVVLYDAAFTIIIKRSGALHQRGILIVTLVAGLASFIFQPLTSALATAYDWRAALVVLAVILGVVTVPVHWVVLRPTTGAGGGVGSPTESG
jgi:MFS family permease